MKCLKLATVPNAYDGRVLPRSIRALCWMGSGLCNRALPITYFVTKVRRELLATSNTRYQFWNYIFTAANLVLTSAQTFLSGRVKIRIFPGERPGGE
jgi:hypothetical protein